MSTNQAIRIRTLLQEILLISGRQEVAATKDPDDPEEVIHCPECETEVKIKDTARQKMGNELHMTWKCSGCGYYRSGVIILGPPHSIMKRHPDPGENEKLREAMRAGYRLSTYAASIHWDGSENTPEWIEGLGKRIQDVQEKCKDLDPLLVKPAFSTAWGQGGAAHPDADPEPEDKVGKILAEQRALYPGRTCANCWYYERIMRAENITVPDGTLPLGGEKTALHPEHCNTFLILPEEPGCADWKHHEDTDG